MTAPRLHGPFKYRTSVETDIRRTFLRVRKEMAAAAQATVPTPPVPAPVVAMEPEAQPAPRVRRVR